MSTLPNPDDDTSRTHHVIVWLFIALLPYLCVALYLLGGLS